jgi:hypothetical protein
MPYVIRYFRAGREQGSTPWNGSLDMMKKIAADGLVRHGMERAEITDQSGAVVWARVDTDMATPRPRAAFIASALRAVGGLARRT